VPSGSIFAQTCCWSAAMTAEFGSVSASNCRQSLRPLLKKTRMASFFEAFASFRVSGQLVFH